MKKKKNTLNYFKWELNDHATFLIIRTTAITAPAPAVAAAAVT